MKIIVCIKQVPGTSKVEIDATSGVLKRDGIESKMNPYDLYALETAFQIKEKLGGTVTVVTMGPPQARAIVKEAYMMGADDGYLLSDRKFAGSDVLATAYTLSQGIRVLGIYDLIICGRQTTDGDTAQVGPAVAEYLEIPHVTWVRTIREADDRRIIVEQDLADNYEIVALSYPCLISVEKGICQPRLPSYKRKVATQDKPVHILAFQDLTDQDEGKYGISGSATQVEQIFPPELNHDRVIWEGQPAMLAGKIGRMLKEAKFI